MSSYIEFFLTKFRYSPILYQLMNFFFRMANAGQVRKWLGREEKGVFQLTIKQTSLTQSHINVCMKNLCCIS